MVLRLKSGFNFWCGNTIKTLKARGKAPKDVKMSDLLNSNGKKTLQFN